MNKKILLLGIIILLPLVLAESSFIFQKNTNVDLKISCINETKSFCSSGTLCQITINKPSGVNLIKNGSMTYQTDYFNYTLNTSQTADVGRYLCYVNCLGETNGFSTFTFEINPTGMDIGESQGFASVGLILSILGVAFLFMYFGFKFTKTDKLFPIAIFFMLISLLLSVYTIHLGYIYNRDILYPLAGEGTQFKVYLGIMWGLLAMAFLAMLGLIIKALKEFRVRKSQQDYGEGWDSKTQSYK